MTMYCAPKFLLLTFVMSLSCLCLAQKEARSFKGGVRAGISTSQISGDDLVGFNKVGATAGIFVNYPLTNSERLKLQLELDFTMKGSHSKAAKTNQTYNFYSLNVWYVEMPLLLEFIAGNWTLWGKPFQFVIEAGPMFGVNVFQREREAAGIIEQRPQFRRFEFSAVAGISLMISDKHGVNVRFSNSVVPVRIPTWVYNRVVKKQFNTVLSFAYTYTF